ncbi:hypothetical protein [Solibacillus sp. CAU 1738]|uniref:hypothetical protein n=1 Tax=Solibacillus sp. CAU 1738 TaxID=3140363 RepID=UPI0032612566
MRYIVFTICFFLVATIIKIDLQEGTLPLAAFYSEEQCTKTVEYVWQTVSVRVQQGDTIYSLFTTTPTKAAFPERLAEFYKANPHLQQQTLVPGELILLPIYTKTVEKCLN